MPLSKPCVERIDIELPVSEPLGRRLLGAGLYAEGNDFSASSWMGEGHRGESRLKALWDGSATRCPWDALTVWILRHAARDVGVVVWERPQTPQSTVLPEPPAHPRHRSRRGIAATDLGGLGAYLHPEFRGRGWVRATVVDHVGPALLAAARTSQATGAFPYVAAEGAMEVLLRAIDIPVSPFYFECGNKPASVWSLNTAALIRDSAYRVAPQPLEPVAAPRRRLRA